MTEKAIRDNFLSCIKELQQQHTLKEIARSIGTNATYLSQLKTKNNPQIPAQMIALLCEKYGYSPFYILMNRGRRKTVHKEDPYQEIINRLLSKQDEHIGIISRLLDGLLEFKASWSNATDELVAQAKKSKQ